MESCQVQNGWPFLGLPREGSCSSSWTWPRLCCLAPSPPLRRDMKEAEEPWMLLQPPRHGHDNPLRIYSASVACVLKPLPRNAEPQGGGCQGKTFTFRIDGNGKTYPLSSWKKIRQAGDFQPLLNVLMSWWSQKSRKQSSAFQFWL